MSLSRLIVPLALLLALTVSGSSRAQCPTCGGGGGCPPPVPVPGTPAPVGKPCCGNWFCCPKFYHCQEKPPKIKIKRVCPKPICDPCSLEGYGYYPVCWRPMGPLNYGHCPTPAPAVLAVPPIPPEDSRRDEAAPMPVRVPQSPDGLR